MFYYYNIQFPDSTIQRVRDILIGINGMQSGGISTGKRSRNITNDERWEKAGEFISPEHLATIKQFIEELQKPYCDVLSSFNRVYKKIFCNTDSVIVMVLFLGSYNLTLPYGKVPEFQRVVSLYMPLVKAARGLDCV